MQYKEGMSVEKGKNPQKALQHHTRRKQRTSYSLYTYAKEYSKEFKKKKLKI